MLTWHKQINNTFQECASTNKGRRKSENFFFLFQALSLFLENSAYNFEYFMDSEYFVPPVGVFSK